MCQTKKREAIARSAGPEVREKETGGVVHDEMGRGEEEEECDRDRAMTGGPERGGRILCREEVICQIGFHSLLKLTAARQPGRLTVSHPPPPLNHVCFFT